MWWVCRTESSGRSCDLFVVLLLFSSCFFVFFVPSWSRQASGRLRLCLCLLPFGFEFFEGHVFQRAAGCCHGFFEAAEAPRELVVRLPQRRFRLDPQFA